MKTKFPLLCALLFSVAQVKAGDIDGDVFVVTNGGNAVKLALTKVDLYDLSELQAHIERRVQDAKIITDYFDPIVAQARKVLDDSTKSREAALTAITSGGTKTVTAFTDAEQSSIFAQKQFDAAEACDSYPRKGLWFLEKIPTPIDSTKTDADAKFHFSAKPGKYALVASSSRKVGNLWEAYFWFVKAPQSGVIHLSNDNEIGSGSSESLIAGRAGLPTGVMAGHDGEWLLNFVKSKTGVQ